MVIGLEFGRKGNEWNKTLYFESRGLTKHNLAKHNLGKQITRVWIRETSKLLRHYFGRSPLETNMTQRNRARTIKHCKLKNIKTQQQLLTPLTFVRPNKTIDSSDKNCCPLLLQTTVTFRLVGQPSVQCWVLNAKIFLSEPDCQRWLSCKPCKTGKWLVPCK